MELRFHDGGGLMPLNNRGGIEPVEYRGFRGIRNTVSAERFGPEDLEAAVNMDIDDTGRTSRRNGSVSVLATAGAHSLWAEGDLAVFVQGTSFKRLAANYVASTLRTVTSGARMAYTSVIGRLFYSNGIENGVVEDGVSRTWGLVPPTGVGIATATPGGLLAAGRYQWTMTYLRDDLQESGTLIAGVITLADNDGIAFSALPVSSDPGVVAKMIYLTPTNGDTFYEALVLDNADTTATYMNDGTELTRPLDTQFCQNPPAGQCVAYFRGQTLVAKGSVLYASLPYGYELFDLRKNFDFESEITLLAPVEGGLFVCTQTHNIFLQGLTPDDWQQQVKTAVGAIPGTLVYAEGKDIGEGVPGVVALWLSQSGICMGTNDGGFNVLTDERLHTNIARSSGASVVIGGRVISTAE